MTENYAGRHRHVEAPLATAGAAWYPDPADPTRQRWWDGQAWTQHTAPATELSPASTAMAPVSAA